jgi:hypothetical protein
VLNETNKDWQVFHNMTFEEWSLFHNATVDEWETLRHNASKEWDMLSQEAKDTYLRFLNATQKEWVDIRQKSENAWNHSIDTTQDQWFKWSNSIATEFHNLQNQSAEDFRNIDSHVKDSWSHVNKSADDAVIKVAEEYYNVTDVVEKKVKSNVNTGRNKLKKTHAQSLNEPDNLTDTGSTTIGTKRAITHRSKSSSRDEILKTTTENRSIETHFVDDLLH